MGSWLFSNGQSTNTPTVPASGLRIQTSQQGRPKIIGWGQTRISGNVIWYGAFEATAVQNTQQGGKGGGSSNNNGSVSYTYSASFAVGLCEGPIAAVLNCWKDKSVQNASALGFSTFLGSYSQSPWGYLTSLFPGQDLAYRGLAYEVVAGYDLGSSPDLPNLSWEVRFAFNSAIAGQPDADAKDVVIDTLTNAHYGIGWPVARLDTVMTLLSNYSRATGMVISPALIEQRAAASFLADVMQALNSEFRWSNGVLTVVPYGDQPIAANGANYVPNVAPFYDLTENDFLPSQGGGGASGASAEPVTAIRKRRADMLNSIKVEYLDRAGGNYDPALVGAKDQASIDTFGLRASDLRQLHMFNIASAAVQSASLQLAREQIPNTYTFTLGPRFILLDVLDIVTLTRPTMGMLRQPVRITEIQENTDSTLNFTAEEFTGTAAAPIYGTQAGAGHTTNQNAPPGGTHAPIIFEPTAELLGGAGLEVWGAVCGLNLTLWGGCNVYVSFDDTNYALSGPPIRGAARMGTLTAPLAAVAVNQTGPTIDAINTLAVDLSESGAILTPGTITDVLALTTSCYVNGEIIAFRDANLSAQYNYNLFYLNRGVYGTEDEIVTHAIGAPFARLDQGIFKVPYDKSRIGSTIYLKFQSFNAWGGGIEDISLLSPVTYVLTGSALASPLANVTNLRTAYLDNRTKIDWDEIADFRPIMYEVRLGASWNSGLSLGTLAHPPLSIPGDGTFWVSGVSQPAPGLVVYSENPVSIVVTGALINGNVLVTRDLQALHWPGTFTGGAGVDLSINAIRTGGAGNILTDPSILINPNILDSGGEQSGTYEIDPSLWIDAGYNTLLNLGVAYQGQGVPVGQDILSVPDFLNLPDVLGSASTQFTNIYLDVAIAQDSNLDVFGPSDIFSEPDVFRASVVWSPWQKFSPGVYPGRFAKFLVHLDTIDPATIAYLTKLIISALIPARVDQYINQTVPDTGLVIAFQPTGTTVQRPFNGGPSQSGATTTATLPGWNAGITNATPGDDVIVQGLTLSGCTVFVQNGGGNVTRTGVNLQFFGY